MAEMAEKYNSRRQTRGQQPSQEITYVVVDAIDDNDAQAYCLAHIELLWNVGGTLVPISETSSEAIADSIFEVTVKWGTQAKNFEAGEETTSFDTSGGKAKISHSLSTTSYPYPGRVAPNHNNAIGVTKSTIEGVEVTVPALTFSIEKTLSAALVTPTYIKTLAFLTGKYNQDTFKTFEPGEVRFDGASGNQKQPGADVVVKFKFTVEQNRDDLTVAGVDGISKLGWQYLWVESEEYEDTASKQLSRQTVAVHIEDVPNLEPADFASLGIGVT